MLKQNVAKILTTTGRTILVILLMQLLSGCNPFEYSPSQAKVEPHTRGLIRENLRKISDREGGGNDSFAFAVIADSHTDYDELRDAVAHLNRNSKISFVIHAGDLTDWGLLREYEWTVELLSELKVPYLTVIGNHDCLTNGKEIYRDMFGEYDYSFVFSEVHFIIMNTNVWEFAGDVPNFSRLKAQLTDCSSCKSRFVVSHVAPFGDQMTGENGKRYCSLLKEYDVALSIHGHRHDYYCGDPNDDNVTYLIVDAVEHRNYCVVSVDGEAITVERVYF